MNPTFIIDPRICAVTGVTLDCRHTVCRAQDQLAIKQTAIPSGLTGQMAARARKFIERDSEVLQNWLKPKTFASMLG